MQNSNSTENLRKFEAIKQALSSVDLYGDVKQVLYELEKEWEVIPVESGNKVIGAVLVKWNEVHIGVSKDFHGRWNPRKYLRQVVYPLIDKYGEVVTTSPKIDKVVKWNLKLGFVPYHENDTKIFYIMKEKKYGYR